MNNPYTKILDFFFTRKLCDEDVYTWLLQATTNPDAEWLRMSWHE